MAVNGKVLHIRHVGQNFIGQSHNLICLHDVLRVHDIKKDLLYVSKLISIYLIGLIYIHFFKSFMVCFSINLIGWHVAVVEVLAIILMLWLGWWTDIWHGGPISLWIIVGLRSFAFLMELGCSITRRKSILLWGVEFGQE